MTLKIFKYKYYLYIFFKIKIIQQALVHVEPYGTEILIPRTN